MSFQVDPINSAFSSASIVRGLRNTLTQEDVPIQAVLAFEALGTKLTVSPELLDRGIIALGGNEDVRIASLKQFIGYRTGDLAMQLRQSNGCVCAFLLTTSLKGCAYSDTEIGEILFHMVSETGGLVKTPCAAKQMEKLVIALSKRMGGLLDSVAECNMCILNAAVKSSNAEVLDQAWQRLNQFEMAKLLISAFSALHGTKTDVVELRGSKGLFEFSTTMIWLNPDKVGLSVGDYTLHPGLRKYIVGDDKRHFVIQASTSTDSRAIDAPKWIKIPWPSVSTVTKQAIGWAEIAHPLMPRMPATFSGVALNAAKKWMS